MPKTQIATIQIYKFIVIYNCMYNMVFCLPARLCICIFFLFSFYSFCSLRIRSMQLVSTRILHVYEHVHEYFGNNAIYSSVIRAMCAHTHECLYVFLRVYQHPLSGSHCIYMIHERTQINQAFKIKMVKSLRFVSYSKCMRFFSSAVLLKFSLTKILIYQCFVRKQA